VATDAGWIKLWRKARENPYLQDVVQRAVFFTLLLDAEPVPTDRRIKRAVVPVGRGQSLVTERELAAELKLGRQQIRRAIANLKKGGLINPRTNPQTNPETNPGWTLVTICNFERYQRLQPAANPETNPETNPTLRRKEEEEEEESNVVALSCNDRASIGVGSIEPTSADSDLDAMLYRRGKSLLGDKAGGMITKLKKSAGLGGALEILDAARRKESPIEYVAGAIRSARRSVTIDPISCMPIPEA
jgi:Bacterial regulatory proteins, gntR family